MAVLLRLGNKNKQFVLYFSLLSVARRLRRLLLQELCKKSREITPSRQKKK
jgi:hypothetical protein